MISALSGNGALSLLSLLGRPKAGQASQPAASQPPPPPPPPPQGNGISAQSLFEALFSGQTSAEDLSAQVMATLDGDGDGQLSAEELTQALSDQTAPLPGGASTESIVRNILANLDSDGDQSVSAEELTSGLEQLAAKGPPPSAEDAASGIVSALDTDGDGKLSAEELAAAFKAPEAAPQKSLQELVFGLLLEQQDPTSLYA